MPYDIGLVKLSSSADYTDYVQAVEYATTRDTFSSTDECFISGWGMTSGICDIIIHVSYRYFPNFSLTGMAVYTHIRLLQKEYYDLGLHCLSSCLHLRRYKYLLIRDR